MQMRRQWSVFLVVLGLLAGCSGGGGDVEPDGATRQGGSEGGTWTVLAYSIADTDLEPFLLADVDEMAEVGSGEGLDIVALVDRAADYSSDGVVGLEDWTGGRLLEITKGGAEILEELGDVNTGDPEVLAGFIAAGVDAYPADNYALIISDHGASWPGVGGDESAEHDGLTLDEMSSGIGAGLEAAGVEKLDLLGFDACLMATYEVATTLAPHAERMLASQELEPGHGWDYTALQVALDDDGLSVDELGTALIDGFEAQAEAEGTESEITLSLIDLTQMAAVDEALATFTGALVERGAAVAPTVGRTLAKNLGFGRSPDPFEDTQMTDLGILAGTIGVEALDVSDAADALVRAINDAVVDKVDGRSTSGATGLSIYFPPRADYFSAEYRQIETAGDWMAFLDSYYEAGAAIPEGEQAAFTGEAETFFDEDGLNITGLFELAAEDNLAEAFVRYGLVEDDGSISFLGEEPGAIAEDGSGLALGIFDLTALTISDGEDSAYGYLDMTVDEESGLVTIDVPMAYYAPDDVDGETYQDVLLSLVLDGETGDLVSETYYVYDDDLGTYGEATLEPEGIIVPEVLNILDDGTEEWIATSDVGLFADLPSLAYDVEDLESGTEIYVELYVVDFGGNYDTVSAYVTVP